MNNRLLLRLQLIALFAVLQTASISAQDLSVVFEPPAQPDGVTLVPEWIELGLRFTTPTGVASNDSSSALFPFNGTAYLQLLSGESPLSITGVSSQPFSVLSIDLAEYSTSFPIPASITFTGTRSGGGTVNVTFVTDGIIDGNGPSGDFETFSFPASFSNLTELTTVNDTFSMDNLAFATVPEPAVVCLSLLGGAFACVFHRRRRISDDIRASP